MPRPLASRSSASAAFSNGSPSPPSDNDQKTYSADQLAALSKMPIGMVRELSQLSLLDERDGRFGFRDLASARQIAKLLNDGRSPVGNHPCSQ